MMYINKIGTLSVYLGVPLDVSHTTAASLGDLPLRLNAAQVREVALRQACVPSR